MIKQKVILFSFFIIFLISCGSIKKGWDNLNVFPVEYDVELGQQVSQDIASKPDQFPILEASNHRAAYQYIRKIIKKILNSGKVENKGRFEWEVKIIRDDKVLNAFATPGGHIYVYTGLIKYLDSEDQLAGVLAHEIAHADRRHSTKQLTKILGTQILLDIVLNSISDKKQATKSIGKVTTALIGLKFSRAHETEADKFSVIYLCPTDYPADGAAAFFEKIKNNPSPPEWISTHPSSSNRVKSIQSLKNKLGCKGTNHHRSEYQRLKKML